MNIKEIVKYIFELNHLKRIKHSGWHLAGIKHPDTVAEHSLRAAQIGYILAVMEDVNPEKVVTMLVFHDNGEIRIGDQNKVSARYYSNKKAEEKATEEQNAGLGRVIGNNLNKFFKECEERKTLEGVVAKDADWLEQAFQAKEYFDLGYKSTWNWIENVEKALETESAKKIIKEMKNVEFTDWWKNLKKMTYQKLK